MQWDQRAVFRGGKNRFYGPTGRNWNGGPCCIAREQARRTEIRNAIKCPTGGLRGWPRIGIGQSGDTTESSEAMRPESWRACDGCLPKLGVNEDRFCTPLSL